MEEEDILNEESGEKDQGGLKEEITYLTGMYRNWFMDYASYVILDNIFTFQ
ncbi:MAG: hypothetical protein PHH93_10150 [Prolixibacteraceae bacterium]|nr:hypothetical protein [Prolixibacteraceae bacterium]